MTASSSAFERRVAALFAAQGYEVRLTGGTGDWGVDFFATRRKEKVAVQVKKYAGSRPVNRRQIFELDGAARYFDCNRAIIATDGKLTEDAYRAALKLGIDVWTDDVRAAIALPESPELGAPRSFPGFDVLWRKRVMPLQGKTLRLENGGANRITEVTWGGIRRVSSTGRASFVPIEPFMWALRRIAEVGSVSRGEINEQFEGRFSSFVALVLAQMPEFHRDERSGRLSRASDPRSTDA